MTAAHRFTVNPLDHETEILCSCGWRDSYPAGTADARLSWPTTGDLRRIKDRHLDAVRRAEAGGAR